MADDMSDNFSKQDEPIYNIGAVARMTGIAETTLRAWERRYNFPASARTDGGHRLYSQQEISRLQWVKLQVDEGVQISQAIKALSHKEENSVNTAVQPLIPSSELDAAFAKIYERLLSALLSHNTLVADRIIAEALTLYTMEHLILNIFSPVMRELGSAWERGDINIATEHFATNYLRHYLLQWMRTSPPPYNHVKPVILAGAPGELHEGSLIMFGVLLRRLRWSVNYLGQSIALHDFAGFIEQVQPSAIVFVAMTKQSAEALSEWPRWLPTVHETNLPIVCYAGRIFSINPDYIEQMSGVYLGNTIEEGLSTLTEILNDLYPYAK